MVEEGVRAAKPFVVADTTGASAPSAEPRVESTPPAEYDLAELDEDVELDPAQRKRVLDIFYRLGVMTHYQVLGLARDADKKAVKRSYFELAASFHPDKFFRKRLGGFKMKMETIFGRLTQAHDVLTQKQARSEYDQYLTDQARTRGIETMLKDVLAEMAAAERAVMQSVPEPPPTHSSPATPREAALVPPRATSLPSTSAPSPPPPGALGSGPSVDAQARREMLARRLLGGRAPPARGASAAAKPAANPRHATSADAVDALRRRYEERVAHARNFQSKKYADQAAIALAQNDPVAAANSYKVALTLAPDDPLIIAAHDRAQVAANGILGDTYTRQATYEEKADNFVEAAKSWKRVVQARPDESLPHERAAHALVRAGGDLHEAAKLGLRACSLEPTNAKYRVTLANVYLAAGLHLNAKREVEVAAQLSPQDDTIAALLKRVSKAP